MKSKRALRRHHLNRIKQLALEQAKALFPSQRDLWVPQMICRYRNRKPCSCRMCGNPRRYACRIAEQITRQEHLAALREAEQSQEATGGYCAVPEIKVLETPAGMFFEVT